MREAVYARKKTADVLSHVRRGLWGSGPGFHGCVGPEMRGQIKSGEPAELDQLIIRSLASPTVLRIAYTADSPDASLITTAVPVHKFP